MNRFMYGPSFFSFYILSFSISFPQINHFYYFTSLHGLQDVENHCAHLRDIELKILYIIGLESMKLQKNIFASNPEIGTQKQAQKDMNEME